MTSEEKVITKLRKVLIADTVINGYVETRVYAAHVSTIVSPTYPCISIHLLGSNVNLSLITPVSLQVQIDSWFPSSVYSQKEAYVVHERLRALLHRQNLIDDTLGLKVATIFEVSGGPMIQEEDTRLYHYPVVYSVVTI